MLLIILLIMLIVLIKFLYLFILYYCYYKIGEHALFCSWNNNMHILPVDPNSNSVED